jgi:hypothetical protein
LTKLRLAEQYLLFHVDKLKEAAVNSINKREQCQEHSQVSGSRLKPNAWNGMEDKIYVLTRLSSPSMLPQRLAVVSEVAHMAF